MIDSKNSTEKIWWDRYVSAFQVRDTCARINPHGDQSVAVLVSLCRVLLPIMMALQVVAAVIALFLVGTYIWAIHRSFPQIKKIVRKFFRDLIQCDSGIMPAYNCVNVIRTPGICELVNRSVLFLMWPTRYPDPLIPEEDYAIV